jgi:hypothetical protein
MHLPIGNLVGRFMMVRMIPTRRFAAATLVCLLAAAVSAQEPKWVPLFNGKDLSGWTPKIAKRPLGENFANTFRVEDGILKVSYDGYTTFDEQFGHLFTNLAYSHYILRLEYRFTGTIHGVTLERLSEPSPEVAARIADGEFLASLATQ